MFFYPTESETDEANINAIVKDVEKTDYGYSLDANAHSVNGKRHINYKLKIYVYSSDVALKAGDEISFRANLRHFDDNGAFNFKQYYTARGYRASANVYKLDITGGNHRTPIEYRITQFRRNICDSFVNTLGDNEGGLLSALLLGERDMMDSALRLDFSRIGISHILALSGMHLVMLTAALEFILRVFGIGKRKRMLFSVLFVALFMALTGFPSSVCRAGLMLIISNVVYLIFGCKDHVTSLFIALTIILVAEPYAALDSGLWLSCLATFGILAASDIYKTKTFSKCKFLNGLASYGVVSLFAVCATFALSIMLFDGFSFVSPLMTYIFGFMTELYVYVGLIVFALAQVFPATSSIVTYLYGFIASTCGVASERIPYVYTSTSILPIQIGALILSALLLAVVLLNTNTKRKNLLVIALTAVYAMTSVISVASSALDVSSDRIVYTCDENDLILLNSSGVTALIQASYAPGIDEAYSTLNFALGERVMQVDYLVITDVEYNSQYYAEKMLSGIKIGQIVLPLPKNDAENEIIEQIYKISIDNGASVAFYEMLSPYRLGNVEFISVSASELGSTYSKIFTLKSGNDLYSYVSEMDFFENTEAYSILNASSHLIVGAGPSGDGVRYISSVSDKLRSLILTSDNIIVENDAASGIDLSVKPKRVALYGK